MLLREVGTAGAPYSCGLAGFCVYKDIGSAFQESSIQKDAVTDRLKKLVKNAETQHWRGFAAC